MMAARPEARRVAGVELGGTKVLVTAGSGPEDAPPPVEIRTGDPENTLAEVVRALENLQRGGPFAAVGVASFGPIELDAARPRYGRILTTPKPRWSGADVLGPLRRFGAPLALETDVNAAALAEGRWGAAMGLKDHVYITVGTGVGVGVVSNGAAVHGAGHPEAGHLLVVKHSTDLFEGACPFHGACVEGMISGPALERRLGRPAEDLGDDDPAWTAAGDYLAQLVMALVLVLAPKAVVVGGGVGARPRLIGQARSRLVERLGGYVPRLSTPAAAAELIRPAALPAAGLMGALHLAGLAASTSPLDKGRVVEGPFGGPF